MKISEASKEIKQRNWNLSKSTMDIALDASWKTNKGRKGTMKQKL